jgi:multidrug efflux pump subunit AcrA (membrane-fusion protein)
MVLVVAVVIFQWLLSSRPERKPPALTEKVWRVAVVEIHRQRLSPQLRLYGQIEAEERARVTAPAAGEVEAVYLREGERAEAGQLLLRLSPGDFELALQQRQAEVEDLQAQLEDLDIRRASDRRALAEERALLELARKDLERVERLQKSRLSSDSAISDARERLGRQQLSVIAREQALKRLQAQQKQLLARMKKAEAAREQARISLQRSAPRAPAEVLIDELPVAVGDRLRGGDLMVSWYRPDSLEVRARVPLRYREELQDALAQGQPLFAVAGGQRFRLERVAARANAAGIDIWLRPVGDARSLRPGLQLELLLDRPARDAAFEVPATALYDERRVFRVVDGRMRSVAVQPVGFRIDASGRHWRLIESEALQPGDRIIVTHLPGASDGLRVELMDADAALSGETAGG